MPQLLAEVASFNLLLQCLTKARYRRYIAPRIARGVGLELDKFILGDVHELP